MNQPLNIQLGEKICEMEFYNLQFYNNFTSTLLHKTVFRPPPFHSGARRA